MKPMKVEAGEHAADLEALLKEAKMVEGKFGSKNADGFESVRGVETVQPGYYSTNQQTIEVEDVKRSEPKKEEVDLDAKQHSSHDDALSAHENTAGDKSDKNPQSPYSLTDYY
tara:strand:+ start:1090 stop:1428 length:339 start_codon:yes stop_codon:yes gene_type:complete